MSKGAGGANRYAVPTNETELFGPVKTNRNRFPVPGPDDFSGTCLAADSTTGTCFLVNNEQLHDIVLPFEFSQLPRVCLPA